MKLIYPGYFWIFLVFIGGNVFAMETKQKAQEILSLEAFDANNICGICFKEINAATQKICWVTSYTHSCHKQCAEWIEDKEQEPVDTIIELCGAKDSCERQTVTIAFNALKKFRGYLQERSWPHSLQDGNLDQIIGECLLTDLVNSLLQKKVQPQIAKN